MKQIMRIALPIALTGATALWAFACGQPEGPGPSSPTGAAMESLTVTSKSIPSGSPIPVDYTCDGKNVSPQLTWSAPPEGTKSIVVVLDDPDMAGGTVTHWILFDLAPDTLTLPEAVDAGAIGAKLGQNDAHNVSYAGPCPPRGDGMHRVQFHVFALSARLPFEEGMSRAQLDGALVGHVLGHGALSVAFGH